MLWRYVKSQVLVLLCGGLVGPIFLAVYFALGQDSLLKWMFYVGLFVTVADVLIALALANYGATSAARRAALEQNGVLALAQITEITETGTRINGQPLVKLQLHISGPGFMPFDREDRVIASVSRLPNITSRKLAVLVDPATLEYQIDWKRSALADGVMPAQLTAAEDNKAYDLSRQAGPLSQILQILKANNVPLSPVVDVRSNPLLRQQIQAVVRRAAGAAQAAPAAADQLASAAAPLATAPEQSIAERLQKLKTLHDTGAVTDQEYASRRAQIISEL